MARKRIIYQSEALYAGTTGQASPLQLHRIQDVSHSVEVTRTDVNAFGQLAALSREVIEAPTVGCDFSYYVVDGYNESGLGFSTNGSSNCLSGLMASGSSTAQKNYYIMTSKEGEDAIGSTVSDNGVIGIGNGYITSYGVEASVGEIPTASVSAEGINIRFNATATSFGNPGINPVDGTALATAITLPAASTGSLTVPALRPGDITLSFGSEGLQGGGVVLPGMNAAGGSSGISCIQSVSIDVPLGRTPLQCLGDTFPTSRELDFPINVTMAVSANVADIMPGTLRDLLCNDAQKRDISVQMNTKCSSTASVIFTLKNAQLDSQNMSVSIGDNKTVDLSFSAQVGGSNDGSNGLFISGVA